MTITTTLAAAAASTTLVLPLVAGAAPGAFARPIPIGATRAVARVPAPSGPDVPIDGPEVGATGSITIYKDHTWSGYATLPERGKATGFKTVQASFTVPSVNCAATPDTFSYHWVGLDGFSDATLEQDGVAADCEGKTPTYFAWYEMYPLGLSRRFAVSPGDAIHASVTYDPSADDYALVLDDPTSGQSFDLTESCPVGATCRNTSAEVITEGYDADANAAGTSDFGLMQYRAVTVTDTTGRGQAGALENPNWTTVEAISYGQSKEIDTQPGPITESSSPAQSAFVVRWLHEN